MTIVFISGHLDITPEEFATHYQPKLDQYISQQASFIIGDARGADQLSQTYLSSHTRKVTVYHMLDKPRFNEGNFDTVGGFISDNSRDTAMTQASTTDLAWIRPGREKSGTARNLKRRLNPPSA